MVVGVLIAVDVWLPGRRRQSIRAWGICMAILHDPTRISARRTLSSNSRRSQPSDVEVGVWVGRILREVVIEHADGSMQMLSAAREERARYDDQSAIGKSSAEKIHIFRRRRHSARVCHVWHRSNSLLPSKSISLKLSVAMA